MRIFTSHAIGAATAGAIALGSLVGPAAAADIPYPGYQQSPEADDYYGNPPPVERDYRYAPPQRQYGYPPQQPQYDYPPQTYYDPGAVAPSYGAPPIVVAPPYYGRPGYGPVYGAPYYYGPRPYPYVRYGHNWRRFGHHW
jgi:hypothetical protein